MNKEQKIKELKQFMFNEFCYIGKSVCNETATKIVNELGYRKQSEVAKEIFEIINTYWEDEDSLYLICSAIEQKYGVEL